MWPRLANAVGFQLVWLCCVAGAGSGRAWAGPLAASAFALLTLGFGGHARSDLRLLALALPIGLAFDSSLAALGWIHYADAWPAMHIAPAWILALWSGFALTLNHSLAFLKQRPALSALFGLVGGPMAYVAAERAFHAVQFAEPQLFPLMALAFGWAVAIPLLFRLDALASSARVRGATA